MSAAARGGYDLVVANGFLMGDATAAVAKRFPDTKFAIIDFPWVALKGKPKNVRGLVFKETEAGYLAGVAAATVAKGAPRQLGRRPGRSRRCRVPRRLQGRREEDERQDEGPLGLLPGLRRSRPSARRSRSTRSQQGSKVVFAAAGGCGLGALQAAKEQGAWGIGVDADQAYLGTHMLTSATKKVDFAVFTTAGQAAKGTFKGGTDGVFTVKNGGVGFGKVSVKAPKRAALIAKLTAVSKQIAAGKIKPPIK